MSMTPYTAWLKDSWREFSTREWLSSLTDNTTPSEDANALWKHFSITYLSMRIVLFLLAFTMPVVLSLYGEIRHGLEFQSSMSSYFWAAETEEQCATFPMRTIFVGYLFAVGVFLFAYKGLTGLENTLLNLAALCAFAVAVYPEKLTLPDSLTLDPWEGQLFHTCGAVAIWAKNQADSLSVHIHWVAAMSLFIFLAIVAVFCADKSLKYLPAKYRPGLYRYAYKVLGGLMLVFPLIGFLIAYLLDLWPHKVFIIETLGVVIFGLYWSIKTIELSLSSLEKNPTLAVQHEKEQKEKSAT